ncbi:AbrB/MazE/SpoVT family DNA-binding domain-containing protein [Candidatus Micrarchaeota archaeon]|nr:AbrB/MazE/SpoVT family DNA-binding domain-containing protein [Candidatus Micrarchaeota archaeon]
MVYVIYERGQLVIPKYFRELLGWGKGTKLNFEVKENSLVLKRESNVLTEMEELAKEANLSEKEVGKLVKEYKKAYASALAKRCSQR